MTVRASLPLWINWPAVLAAPRYAGGHEEVMEAIFKPPVTVIARWVEDGYSGSVAFAYRFPDGAIVFLTDYFGSCPGCDEWEGADDGKVTSMVTSLIHSARMRPDLDSAIAFCTEEASNDASEFPFAACRHLAPQLEALRGGGK